MTELGAEGAEVALSSLAKAVDARKRTLHPFDAGTVLESSGNGPLFVRVPTQWEEIDAFVWAARFAAREVGDAAAIEREANATLATVHVIANAVRRKEGEEDVPAFGPPTWLTKRLKADEIARLLDLVNEARIRESGRPRDADPQMVADLASTLASATAEEAAEVCAAMTRDDLVQSLRMLSGMLEAAVVGGVELVEVDDGQD